MKSSNGSSNNHPGKEFLSIDELSALIPYSAGTIRNMITRGDFVRGFHYIKPKGRVVFKWSKVIEWMENEGEIRFRKK